MEDGFFLRVGRQVAKVAPRLASIALIIPAVFTRWAQGLLTRLFHPNTVAGIFLIVVLSFAIGAPAIGLEKLYLSGPSNKDVSEFFAEFLREFQKWQGLKDQFDFVWVAIGTVAVLAVLPWLLRVYLWIVFSSLGFVIWWLVFLISGFDLSKVGEALAAQSVSAPIAPASAESVGKVAPAKSAENSLVSASETLPAAATAAVPQSRDTLAPVSNKQETISETADRHAATSAPLNSLEKHHAQMKLRIDSLLSDLRGRQETNLGLGMLFSIVGVVILAGLVFYGTHAAATDKVEFLLWFIPRLSIVIFIQVFAYFFLGLYRGNLVDIKYFNNELTNMEYKRMGAEVALLEGTSDNPLVPQLALELLKVERNFVLKKGETAADLRDDKDVSVSEVNWGQAIKAIKTLTEALEKKSTA